MSSDGSGRSDGSVDPIVEPEAERVLPQPLRQALHQPGVSPELVQMTIAAFAASYQGPLPPAEQVRSYEQVLPGSFDRILRMAERQQEHRMELERVTVKEAANRSWWGLRLGFVVTMLVVGVGAAAILTGRSLAGFGLILADLAVLAGVFVYGRAQQRHELEEKDRQTRPSLPAGQPPSTDGS